MRRRCVMSYLKRHGTRRVPQWAPLQGQEPNSAGGFAWAVDAWTRLRRFLVLGSEGGSYYASEWSLTRENAQAVEQCVREDGVRAVAEIVRVSTAGRAPKNDPALYALALAAGVGEVETRQAALAALPQVARTGTHLFQFALFVEGFRGWGRSLRRAVGRWYATQAVDALAYQAVKYRQRAGVTHRDLLRLAHPARRVGAGNPELDVSDEHARLFEWIVRARVHPIAVLAALRTYASGRGVRGRGEWNPVREIVDALDAAFYTAFGNVEPAGMRLLLALDVSGSMTGGHVAGVPGLTPRDASAALALVTAATESRNEVVGFFAGKGGFKVGRRRQWYGGADGLTPLTISPRQRLDDAVKAVSDLPFGGTDCA